MKKIVSPYTTFLLLFILTSTFAAVDGLSSYDSSNKLSSANSILSLGPLVSLDDTVYVKMTDCGDRAEVCMDISLSDLSNIQIFENGVPYSSGIAGCDFDTVNFYSYQNLFGQGNSGPYILNNWKVNNSVFSAPFNTIMELVDSMNVWDPSGNWQQDPFLKGIYGGDPANTYHDMIIFVVVLGSPATLQLDDLIIPNGTALNFGAGIYQVTLVETTSGLRDTFVVFASCITTTTITDTLEVGEVDTFCLDFSELPAEITAVFNICPPGDEVGFQLINGDSCLVYSGLRPGVDTACVVACDRLGLCDTTNFIINVPSAAGYREYFDTLYRGDMDMLCLNTVVFIGDADTIYNVCNEIIDEFVKYEIDTINYCISYDAVMHGGTNDACIIMCDELGDCDTTIMHITVRRPGPMYVTDSILLNASDIFCDFDTTNLNGSMVSIENFCPSVVPEAINFEIDTVNNCVNYTALATGVDTACMLLTDASGGTDTLYLIVHALPPVTDWIYDTIRMGLIVDYCLDTTELAGLVPDTAFLCEPFSGTSLNFDTTQLGLCVSVEGMAEGSDTICLYICDEFMVCDTTYLVITVQPPPPGIVPVAVDDNVTTFFNTPVTVDVQANDTIPVGGLSNFFILPIQNGGAGPMNGTAVKFSDNSIQYIPDTSFCGDVDRISYVICNNVACDTAVLTITVECPAEELKFYSGFSPNGDSVNDFFVIEGIENFPNHTLYIFNRWGNQVLESRQYQNNWDGTWEGSEVPEGTYFYLFDDGLGNTYHGYVVIHR